jgi:hypothetical protein
MPPKGALLEALDSIDWENETRTNEEIVDSLRDQGLVRRNEENFFPHEIDKRRVT